MPRKHVAVILRRGPVGSNGPAEGMRAAMGLTAGTEENSVVCCLCDDAVYFALADVDRGAAQKHVDAVAATGARLLVSERSLETRSLVGAQLAEPFTVVPEQEFVKAIAEAGASLAF